MADNTFYFGTGDEDVTWVSAGLVRSGLSFQLSSSKAKYNTLGHFTQEINNVRKNKDLCQ